MVSQANSCRGRGLHIHVHAVYRPKKSPVNVTFQISGELPEMATTIASRTTACGAPTLASKNGIGAAVFASCAAVRRSLRYRGFPAYIRRVGARPTPWSPPPFVDFAGSTHWICLVGGRVQFSSSCWHGTGS